MSQNIQIKVNGKPVSGKKYWHVGKYQVASDEIIIARKDSPKVQTWARRITQRGQNILDVKLGNSQLGSNILIMSSGLAINCPSQKLGLCQVCDRCYAQNAEHVWPETFVQRFLSGRNMASMTADQIVQAIESKFSQRKLAQARYFRLNEASDFYSVEHMKKLDEVARILKERYGLLAYAYTARVDLVARYMPEHIKISVSGHEMPGVSQTVVINEARECPEGFLVCPKTRPENKKTGQWCGVRCTVCMSQKVHKVAFVAHGQDNNKLASQEA